MLRKIQRGKLSVFENLGEVTKDELSQLRAETRRLAKAANQRLRRMEDGPTSTSPAYKRAMEDLRTEFGAPRVRYRENVVTASRQELIDEYKSLRDFMTSKTSTVSGYKEVIKERWKRFKDETGADISEEDYVDAWEKIGADDGAKNLYYRSQFQLIKEASKEWNAIKDDPDRDPDVTYQSILQEKIDSWSGKSYIESLRG